MTLHSVSHNSGSRSGGARSIADNVHDIRRRIEAAAEQAGRRASEVNLVAVSKTRQAAEVREAAAAGCTDFAENYLQEADGKIRALADLQAIWHFVGAIQSNKTRTIAERFHWVHTVSRAKIAERLSAQCPPDKTLNVTLQVNIDQDPDKAGVPPEDAAALLDAVAALPGLRVRGLMTILQQQTPGGPTPLDSFRRLADLFGALTHRAPEPWDTLSMGMSNDFPAAIAAGATHVRIGTAVFGPRKA